MHRSVLIPASLIRAAGALALAAALVSGCAVKDKLYTPSEAEQKLVAFCQKQSPNATTFKPDE